MEIYQTAPAGTVTRARDLRRNPTDAEKRLWLALRQSLPAAKFRRQVPITPYFVDFLSFANRLIVELDGGQHAETQDYDARRTAFLQRKGYKVLRFWNTYVVRNLQGVLETIARNLPLPLPPGEGRGPPRSGGKGEAGTAAGRRKTSPSHAQERAGPSLSRRERA